MPYNVPDRIDEPLYAIVPYFNPWRWKSREKHTTRALTHFHDSGVTIVFVEIAFNRRAFAFENLGLDRTPSKFKDFRHRHIQLRTRDELWLKENAINLGRAALPYDAQNLCWLDSDIHFLRPNWVGATIHALQHYAFVQMFSHARDLGPNYELMDETYPHADGIGWVQGWKNDLLPGSHESRMMEYGGGTRHVRHAKPFVRTWPGLAWACTGKAWDDVGGLFDAAVWGGGDWHMAHALIERRETMMRKDLHPNYQALVNAWFDKCVKHVRRNVGVVEGSIVHHWHGRKTERGYNAKHQLLAKIGFDPLNDLKRDSQGLWQLHDDGSEAFVQLRDAMRAIARERNEDSPETEFVPLRDNH